ncbi:MAG: hypothetical protein JWQ38_1816 [Flavipsychrobacter sp.]|nr:hypothetical protein [Flavipsychrobacter sp.]
MSKTLFTFLCLITIGHQAISQILPKEGSALNYRLIGFSPFTTQPKGNYEIQVASGNQNTSGSFEKNIFKKVACSTSHTILEVPSFGSDYTWRTAIKDGSNTTYSELHHFTTLYSPKVDPSKMRLRILQEAAKNKDAYVFLDGTAIMYDMKGNPVWFLPKQFDGIAGYIRDLKLTPVGTITFMAGEAAYEINYDGDVLWKAPDNGVVSGDRKEFYHHEFTRLSSGNYMILGNEGFKVPLYNTDNTIKKDTNGADMDMKLLFGTVIEYNKKGEVVWSWKSSKYYKESDLVNYFKSASVRGIMDLHENAFYFDEKDKVIYISFRGISRVLKIRYPDGTVLGTYGEIYKPNMTAPVGNGLFCGQHACKCSQIGCLFLFNNNGCSSNAIPKVKKFMESEDEHHSLKKIWEYQCKVDSNAPKEFPSGGNVSELPDHSLFVCMGSQYSKVFIVGMDKKIYWSALPEEWNNETRSWSALLGYRASILYDRKLLKQMVWSSGVQMEYQHTIVANGPYKN